MAVAKYSVSDDSRVGKALAGICLCFEAYLAGSFSALGGFAVGRSEKPLIAENAEVARRSQRKTCILCVLGAPSAFSAV
jgi:hypothetical protein